MSKLTIWISILCTCVEFLHCEEAPTVALSPDCPEGPEVKEGYIKEGSTATCKCELATRGDPTGQAQWYTQEGEKTGTVNTQDGSAALNVSYDNHGPNSTFECRAESALNLSSPDIVQFSPKFAFGPSVVMTRIEGGMELDLCKKKFKTIRCKVPTDLNSSAVQPPYIFFRHRITGDEFIGVDSGPQPGYLISNHVTSTYFLGSDFTFKPPRGGLYTISCTAMNAFFPELSVEYIEEKELIVEDCRSEGNNSTDEKRPTDEKSSTDETSSTGDSSSTADTTIIGLSVGLGCAIFIIIFLIIILVVVHHRKYIL